MNKRNHFRTVVVTLVMVTVLIASSALTFADSFTSKTPGEDIITNLTVNGTILPTTIKVTHPITATWTVTPDTGVFVGSSIGITNDSPAPVSVTVAGLTAQGSITDVAENGKVWANLTAAETQQFIALALDRSTGAWTGVAPAKYWSANASSSLMGVLNPGTAGQLAISDVRTGKAVTSSIAAAHTLELVFSLA